MLRLAAALAAWIAPVPGDVVRPFSTVADPFARGQHRGLDLAARPGDVVRAPCPGRVTFAGPLPDGGAGVTIGCGTRRVSLLPVRPLARRGAIVRRGARVGVATGELHLGVRGPRGYVDPARFLGGPPPSAGPPPVIVGRPPRRHPLPRGPAPPSPGLPGLGWAGLALVAVAAAGSLARPRWPSTSRRRSTTSTRRRIWGMHIRA